MWKKFVRQNQILKEYGFPPKIMVNHISNAEELLILILII